MPCLLVSPENREQITNIGCVRCITWQRCDSNDDDDTPNGRGALKTAPALVIREQPPKGAHNDLLGILRRPLAAEPGLLHVRRIAKGEYS